MRIDPLHIWLACLAIWFGLLSVVCMNAGAVELVMTGNATGQGIHTLEVLPDIKNLTAEEAAFLLGPAYGYNVSRSGLVTFENGSTWQIIRCPNTEMWETRE